MLNKSFNLILLGLIFFISACSTTKDQRLQIPIEIRDYKLGGTPGSKSTVASVSRIKSPTFSTSPKKSLSTSTKQLSTIKSTTTTKNWPRVSRMKPTDANRLLIVSELGDAKDDISADQQPSKPKKPKRLVSTQTTKPIQSGLNTSPNFVWPARGKIIRGYDGVKQKGIEIDGKVGESVLASAKGLVIYTGAGLRGYGKLIVIKHDNDYLTVYGHNSKILVKERTQVAQGQKIAEIGDTDTDRPKLFFQVRKNKTSIDPQKILPKQ